MLFYSMRCKHCVNILEIISKHKALQSVISYHDVNTKPIPNQLRQYIQAVPALITQDSKLLTGKEIHKWFDAVLPKKKQELVGMDSSDYGTTLDGNPDTSGGDIFSLDSYGMNLAPEMTPELQAKIDKNVSEAYNGANNR